MFLFISVAVVLLIRKWAICPHYSSLNWVHCFKNQSLTALPSWVQSSHLKWPDFAFLDSQIARLKLCILMLNPDSSPVPSIFSIYCLTMQFILLAYFHKHIVYILMKASTRSPLWAVSLVPFPLPCAFTLMSQFLKMSRHNQKMPTFLSLVYFALTWRDGLLCSQIFRRIILYIQQSGLQKVEEFVFGRKMAILKMPIIAKLLDQYNN